jgi:hypothetical protein
LVDLASQLRILQTEFHRRKMLTCGKKETGDENGTSDRSNDVKMPTCVLGVMWAVNG